MDPLTRERKVIEFFLEAKERQKRLEAAFARKRRNLQALANLRRLAIKQHGWDDPGPPFNGRNEPSPGPVTDAEFEVIAAAIDESERAIKH